MSDDDGVDPQIEVRDTSFVTGSLAQAFKNYPPGITHLSMDGRYHLTTPDEMKEIIETEIDQYRGFRRGKYSNEQFALPLAERIADRYGINAFGALLDFETKNLHGVAVYECGTVETLDVEADGISESDVLDTASRGVILL